MIMKAKVSQHAIVCFKTKVDEAMGLAEKTKNSANCIRSVTSVIDDYISSLNSSSEKLKDSQSVVRKKINALEEKLGELSVQLYALEVQLSDLKDEMCITPSSLVYTDADGNSHEEENPEYMSLCAQADSVQKQCAEVEKEIADYRYRLGHAQSLRTQIASQIESHSGIVFSLGKKKADCLNFIEKLEAIKNSDAHKCAVAHEKLLKIEQVIKDYQAIIFEYMNSIAYNGAPNVSADQLVGINISVNINRTTTNADITDNNQTIRKLVDDDGKLYRVGDDLLKDNTFRINGYEYKTDHQGRTISASGKLSINPNGQDDRNMRDKIDIIGKGDERYADNEYGADDRGHLIGHQFNGSDRMENLVPQNWKINRGCFRELEDSLAKEVKEGKNVTVSVIPFYGGNSRRPDGIFYFYNIEGISHIVLFPNEMEDIDD